MAEERKMISININKQDEYKLKCKNKRIDELVHSQIFLIMTPASILLHDRRLNECEIQSRMSITG
jgi:hypothetical protein